MAYHKSTKDFGKMLDNGITDEWNRTVNLEYFYAGKSQIYKLQV